MYLFQIFTQRLQRFHQTGWGGYVSGAIWPKCQFFSTCVDCPLWLVSLSSWAPEVDNQSLFINLGSAGKVIFEVNIRSGEYSRKYAAICCSLIDMRKVSPHCGQPSANCTQLSVIIACKGNAVSNSCTAAHMKLPNWGKGMDWGGKRHLRFTAAVDGDTALADAALSPGTQRGADPGIEIKQI